MTELSQHLGDSLRLTGAVDSKKLEVVGFERVVDKDLSAPPVSPITGASYIAAPGSTGAWAGHDNHISTWDGNQYVFTVPHAGVSRFVDDESVYYVFTGASWVKANADSLSYEVGTADVTSGGGTVSIPGPAIGMLRVFQPTLLFQPSNPTGAINIQATLNPGGYLLARTWDTPELLELAAPIVIGFGETIDLVNNGAFSTHITYHYFDTPIGDRVLVRKKFSDTPVVVIPAPAAGRQRRFSGFETVTYDCFRGLTAAAVGVALDTAPLRVQAYYGSTPKGVTVSQSAGSKGGQQLSSRPMVASVTCTAATGDYKLATLAPVAVEPCVFIGVYEDLPI